MNTKKILIVEDETLIALELKNRLERQGYQVLPVTGNAEAAVESAVNNRPDVILMDVVLKGEKTGIDAAYAIIEKYTVPIIFITGNTHLLEDERLKRIPSYQILGKPPIEPMLLQTIKNLIGLSKAHC
jgi:DNA-binding response OmpR family regulator